MAAVALLREPLQDPQTLWNDLDADAVAGDHRDIENAPAGALTTFLHSPVRTVPA